MKRKIIGIFIVTLLIASTIPSITALNNTAVSFQNIGSFARNEYQTSYGQPPSIEWNRTYGDSEYEMLYFVQETKDGSYIASGHGEEEGVPYSWVLKLNQFGIEEWNATIPGEPTDIENMANFIIETTDGYLVCGDKGDGDTWENNGFLWKLDTNGNTQWIQIYPYAESQFGGLECVQQTSDRGYIAAGYTAGTNLEDQDALVLKTDSTGTVEWKKQFSNGENWDIFRSVRISDGGGYIFGGVTTLDDDSNFWLVKTDGNGNMEWEKTFGGPKDDFSLSRNCLCTEDGGYIINGVTSSYGAGKNDLWMVKTDENGDMQWTESYGESKTDLCWCMDLTNDGGYIICAAKNYNDFRSPRGDMWVIRNDDTGNVQWSQTFGGEKEDRGYYVSRTSDGGYILAGRTESFGSGGSDGWLIKLGPDKEMETPELKMKRPRSGWIYIWDLFGIPFPFIDYAMVFAHLTFSVEASDPSGISKVEFFIDDIIVSEDTEAPYEYEWNADVGTYILKIRAYNNYGGTIQEIIPLVKKS